MDNEDVGGAGGSVPLILTYFMIMKGIQRMIMIKKIKKERWAVLPTDVAAQLCSQTVGCRHPMKGSHGK